MADLKNRELQNLLPDILTMTASPLDGIEDGDGNDVTNRVVERGSNSDGEWVRLADGTKICFNNGFLNVDIDTGSGSNYVSPEVPWSFPVSFAGNVYGFCLTGTDFTQAWGSFRVISTSSCSLRFLNSVSITDVNIRAVAIGRWK